MTITIREATEKDFPAVLALIRELAEFEKAAEQLTNSVEQMKSEKDSFTCIVAEAENGELAGMALWFMAYYTWVGKALYLDDLYVKEEYRQLKIGSRLLSRVFEVARRENCKRVRWQVLEWNKDAINFYKKAGADIGNEWLNCTFNEMNIKDFKLD